MPDSGRRGVRRLGDDVGAARDDRRARRHRDGRLGERAEQLGGPAGRGGGRRGLAAEGERQGEADGQRDEGDADQEAFGRDDGLAGAAAVAAAAQVPGQPLAPHRVGPAVPPAGHLPQVGAGSVQGADDSARGLQALLHPLDAHGGVLPGDAHGGGQLAPGQFARDLQPPQRQQMPVLVVEPPHRLGDLAPLPLQLEPQDGQFGEVGGRCLLQPVRGLPPGPVPDLPHGDRHQPGPEAVRVAQ